MTQEERNQKIIERAVRDIGKNTGLRCGKWVEKVIMDVSRAYRNPVLSSFDGRKYPNANGCNTSTNIVCVTKDKSFPIEKAHAGWIVCYFKKYKQTGIRNERTKIEGHAMIIKRVSATGIEVVDCNAVGPTTVGTRFLSFKEFYDRVLVIRGKKEYHLYYVL